MQCTLLANRLTHLSNVTGKNISCFLLFTLVLIKKNQLKKKMIIQLVYYPRS